MGFWKGAVGGILTVFTAFAESGVSGKVVDVQGNVVPAAAGRLGAGSGYSLTATSDAEGRYRFTAVPDGVYQLKGEAHGLSSIELKLTLDGRMIEQDVSLSQLAKPMHCNWISGTARGSYEMTLKGWGEAELHASARGTLALFAREGTLTRFGPSGTLKFGRLEATITTGESLVVVSEGKLENAQGVYGVSGVASFAHKVDLKFQREGHGFAVSGTLEEPKVGSLTVATEPTEQAKSKQPVSVRDQ
jgi:hypothetical protein